jgi:mannose-1-phosphate guanylyltransferase
MNENPFRTAMILAAGRGERMLPLTTVLPKPALPLPDGPVVASAVRLAAEVGATRIVVNVCHLADRMAAAIAAIRIDGIEIDLSYEHELMGTAGGLALARDHGLLGDEGAVLVINGDGVFGLDLQNLATRHGAGTDHVTLALLPHPDPTRWSRVTLDPDGRVVAIRPPGSPGNLEVPFLYPGVMAVSRKALDALPTHTGGVPATLWEPARVGRRLGGVVVTGHWREVGTPNDYLAVMGARLAGTTVIESSAEVSSEATVLSSFIGPGAIVAGGAVVEASVVSEGAIVGERALVSRSLLVGEVRVEAEERIIDGIRASKAAS